MNNLLLSSSSRNSAFWNKVSKYKRSYNLSQKSENSFFISLLENQISCYGLVVSKSEGEGQKIWIKVFLITWLMDFHFMFFTPLFMCSFFFSLIFLFLISERTRTEFWKSEEQEHWAHQFWKSEGNAFK